jgi:hypothetical protein
MHTFLNLLHCHLHRFRERVSNVVAFLHKFDLDIFGMQIRNVAA